MLTDRQKKLLKTIVEMYVSDAEPIASASLVDKLGGAISSATIRNEMSALEDEDYISQPHTSAGRIPTEKAYQYYIESVLDKKKRLNQSMEQDVLRIKSEVKGDRERLKVLARGIAEATKQAVFVLYNGKESYYTGLSNLFAQPEFEEQGLVVDISEALDTLDKLVNQLFLVKRDDPEILIGKKNPFNSACGMIIRDCRSSGGGMIVIVGPMRMDYQQNYTLINETLKLLE